ncbi:MAG TPA: single-stranded DNA-binding protein [Natronincola sp.]|nr:single-stranded DNA-binding protein [Natronincola sp.]
MLNKIILIGRLVADPQLRYTQSGIAVTNFTLAVDRPFVSQGGEREADFIDIVTWRKQAEICANHLNKGRLVAVEGRLQVRSYDDQNGIRRKAAEVVADQVRFLDRARSGESEQSESADGPPEPEFDDVPF